MSGETRPAQRARGEPRQQLATASRGRGNTYLTRVGTFYAILFLAWGMWQATAQELPTALRAVIESPAYRHSHWGIRIHEVPDATRWAEELFVEELEADGITVKRSAAGPAAAPLTMSRKALLGLPHIATLRSPPFRENVTLILKTSHNLHASLLPMLLASKHGERTLAAGLRRQGQLLGELGVDTRQLSFGGGAGGTRADYATPAATVQLLQSMARRTDFELFQAALPVLGKDGTLAKVSTQHEAAGKVFAKTGTLLWENTMNDSLLVASKAMAGYLTAKSGRKLVFAQFVNLVPRTREQKAVLEGDALGKLCEIVYAAY